MLMIEKYNDSFESRWDKFVESSSVYGTFLQTRNFLNYHPSGRFTDASFLVMQGSSIVAVIPGCDILDKDGKHFYSHLGSTFGGIILEKRKYNITTLEELMPLIDAYFKHQGYTDALLKQSSDIFSDRDMDLLDYYFYRQDWEQILEVSFYVNLKKVPAELLANLTSSKRRAYKYSCRNGLKYKRLERIEEIKAFYHLLTENLMKFGADPVHTIDELLEFKESRLKDKVDFYGVYTKDNRLVAATMLFYFNQRVMHTQYLAQSQKHDDLKLYAMEYLDYHTILMAREKGFDRFSFGISTEEKGKKFNVGLATFKEGFGCDFCLNKSFTKKFL